MTDETNRWTLATPSAGSDSEKGRDGAVSGKPLVDAPEQPPRQLTGGTQTRRHARKRKRATKIEMDRRNALVISLSAEFSARHNRLPTVGEIADETGYSRQQIYATSAYKEGMIARNSPKSPSDFTHGHVGPAERSGSEPLQEPAVPSQPLIEQIERAAFAGRLDTARQDVGTTEPAERSSFVCYLCGRGIPEETNAGQQCPRCGNRVCFACLELMDHLQDLCIPCERRAKRRKEIWDTLGLVGVILVIIVILVFMALVK